MPDPGFAPSPLHGAAYKVLLERCDVEHCSSEAAKARISATLGDAMKWSKEQPKPVMDAYSWAIQKVSADAENRLKLFNNSTSVFKAYDDIPKPPTSAR